MPTLRTIPDATIVLPVFNEAPTVARVLDLVLREQPGAEVVVIDDASTDGTADALARWAKKHGALVRQGRVRIHRCERNRGKGGALRIGFGLARGSYIAIQDADLEYHPRFLEALLRPLREGRADVVYGSRFLNGANHFHGVNGVGNRALTWWSNRWTRQRLTDTWTGHKAFRRDLLARIRLREDGFAFESELTAKFARLGCRFLEVPIGYEPRSMAEGKKLRAVVAAWGALATARYTLLPDIVRDSADGRRAPASGRRHNRNKTRAA